MNPALLLEWHYLIFLVPLGLASFLLLLSSLQLGHHHDGAGGHSHALGHSSAGAHAIQQAPSAHLAQSGSQAGHSASSHAAVMAHSHSSTHQHNAGDDAESADSHPNVFLGLLGVGRAPLPMVLETFFILWGLSGCLANQWLLPHTLAPSFSQMLPSIGIAFGGGAIGARLAAHVLGRFLPQEETSIVSRDGLYGLKGKVAFPVSETSGRILIYDKYGTLHDETCRIAPNQTPIPRGQAVMVMDRDSQGHLVVEEILE